MAGKPVLWRLGAVALALLAWQGVAMVVDSGLLLATPLQVLARLGTIWREPDFWPVLWFSLRRIGAGFFLALALGVLAAVAAWRWKLVETLLWPYMVTVKAVPVASFIILSLLWLSAQQLTVFICFLMVLPIVYSNVLTGLKNADPALSEMALLYRVRLGRRLVGLYLPQLEPYLLSGCSVGLGLCWKAGVAAEVIAVASGSIGEKLYRSKIYFETVDLFTWTVVIVLASVGFEKAVLFLLKRLLRRLRRL